MSTQEPTQTAITRANHKPGVLSLAIKEKFETLLGDSVNSSRPTHTI